MRWDRGGSRLIFANPTSMKILLVNDDDALIQILTKTLTTHHHIVDVVRDGEIGWIYGSTFEYDLILLDRVLPKLNGISLCRRFRAHGYVTPILLLIAQSSEDQSSKIMQVQGLDAGADDCVVKPVDLAELMARIRALQRRSHGNPFPLLAWGALFLDPRTCEVTYNSQPVFLTTKEYEFLELLLRDSQYIFSSEELIDRLWSSEEFPSEATVRSHLRRIRQKLAAVGAPPDFITTLHGRGYYLKAIATEEVAEVPFSYPKSNSLEKREPIKVMVVDGDRDWLSDLPTLLKPWGFKVTTLADPQQFWIILQAVVPDVLILEVDMPQINGFELCQMLRSDRRWQRLPVLFLSVLSDDATQQQAFTVGADDYLCKPVVGVTLANRILSRLQRMRDYAT